MKQTARPSPKLKLLGSWLLASLFAHAMLPATRRTMMGLPGAHGDAELESTNVNTRQAKHLSL